METQPGIGNKGISTFLSFGAKNVQPDILEKILVGRRETVDLLEQYVREIAQNGANHQVFMVGPRGAGKTHLLRVLYHRVTDLVQARSVVVAYFAEEEYGISGYLDFLIRIINAFMRWYDADRATLETQLNVLRETPESRQEYVAETIISDYVSDKPLLILSENFDAILEALGRQGQAQLRAFLYRHNRISIIASAQAISPDLGREDRPFYGFFSTIYLKKLSYEDSLALLVRLAETEQNLTMLTHLAGKGRAQVRAIHELVKGNHRLLVTFYEFLKADTLADLSVIFMKTMNDLKPYYETFIRFLPAQQQKILHYLALVKTPQKGTDIGKNCFIATASLNKQLNELQRRHLIDVLPDLTDKRNKLYDVSEPLLRIAIEIGEQREGITSLFIDFLALYYSQDEISDQKARFEVMYLNETDPLKKQKLYWEVDARDRALKVQLELGAGQYNLSAKVRAQIDSGNVYRESGNYVQAIEAYLRAIQLEPDNEVIWTNLGAIYCDNQGNYPSAIIAFQKAIELKPNYETAWYNLGVAFSKQGNVSQAIASYQKALQINPNDEVTWYHLGSNYIRQGEYVQAIIAYQKVVQLKPNDATAWSKLAFTYDEQGNYSLAIENYQKAIQVGSEDGRLWFNLGIAYVKQGNPVQAIETLQKSVQLSPDYAIAWYNLGVLYAQKGDTLEALDCFNEAIKLNMNSEQVWGNLGISYSKQGNDNQAINAFKKAVALNPSSEKSWHNLGVNYNKQGNYAKAISAFQKEVEIVKIDSNNFEGFDDVIVKYLQSKTATKPELTELETWLQGRAGFEIISTYVNVYRRVVFGKEGKALYDLPKEQRIFFEREILKNTTE